MRSRSRTPARRRASRATRRCSWTSPWWRRPRSADGTSADLASVLREGAGELLEDITLFDVYAGEQVGEGKRSLAYKLRFRAPDRTLTVDEATKARDAAVAAAGERFSATLRA